MLKKKLIFDFRGLWVDERIDKGGWDLSNFFDRLQYKYFKRVEKKLLAQADQIMVLTKKVVSEVVKLGANPSSKITVPKPLEQLPLMQSVPQTDEFINNNARKIILFIL